LSVLTRKGLPRCRSCVTAGQRQRRSCSLRCARSTLTPPTRWRSRQWSRKAHPRPGRGTSLEPIEHLLPDEGTTALDPSIDPHSCLEAPYSFPSLVKSSWAWSITRSAPIERTKSKFVVLHTPVTSAPEAPNDNGW